MNKPITLLVTLAMGIGALTGMAAPSRSVGQLLDVTGPVEIERARQKPVKVCMLFPLRIDDRLNGYGREIEDLIDALGLE